MSENPHINVMLAGATAAFTVDLLIYPLDTLKTRYQSQDFLRSYSQSPSSSTTSSSKPITSAASAISKAKRNPQLFKGLYQGIGIVVIATLPAAGTFFTVYEAAKGVLGNSSSSSAIQDGNGKGAAVRRGGRNGALVNSAASAIAECASCLVLTPAEVIKQNAQMLASASSSNSSPSSGSAISSASSATTSSKIDPKKPVSTSTSLRALQDLGGKHAGRKLLSGYTALVARNLPFTALQFPVFEAVREWVWEYREPKRGEKEKDGRGRGLLETGAVTGLSAGLAGSLAALITTPMDVVKTRMMLSAGGEESSTKEKKTGGALSITRAVIAERGIKGLFRGAMLRSVWTAVGSGLYLGMYEVSTVWLMGDESKERGEDL
ncbi:mitochondrial carrier domain-containing protein [Xylariaceae sp. FL0255]|nr:mitochondrial carrier domain-containing protein [Xylariaceae sp. FL0255]